MGIYPDVDVDGEGTLLKEQAIMVGTLFSFLAYGFTIPMFVLCLRALAKRRQSTSKWIFTLHVWFMFFFISAYMVLNAIKKVQAFTTYKEYPGGPSAWIIRKKNSDTLRITEDICILLSICLSDGFLLYRTIVFYTTHRFVLLIPGFLYVGSIVIGSLYISVQAQAGANTWTGADFGIPFFIISSLCHLSAVFAIALRLCFYRELVRRVVGDAKEHGTPYSSALAIIIESAVLYAVFSVIYIVLYVLRNAGVWVIVSVLCNVRGIASFLIILRAARQRTQDEDSTCANTFNLASVQHRTRCNTSISSSS